MVNVLKHPAADRARVNKAGVDRLIGLTRRQRYEVAEACDGVCITVDGILTVAKDVLRRKQRAGGGDELDLVVTRLQACELVKTMLDGRSAEIVSSDCARHQDAVFVVQLNDDVINADFAAVLQAIGVGVKPDIVAQLGAL